MDRTRNRNLRGVLRLKRRDKQELAELMRGGKQPVRVVKRARVLQLSGQGQTAEAAAQAVGVGEHTVRRIRKRYREGGLERALQEAPRGCPEPVLKAKQEQEVVAMLCGPAPSGRSRWTVRLATREAMNRKIVDHVGRETIRGVMQDHAIKPWREKNVVRARVE